MTDSDKLILAIIHQLDKDSSHCTASNTYLAAQINCSEATASKSVNKLIELGYVNKIKFDGRSRVLASNLN